LGECTFLIPYLKCLLLKLVSGESTSEETTAVLCKTSLAIGKIPLICNDCSGFVVNRMLMPYLIEFDKMVSEGHDYSHIDTVMRNHGWPMGPAELCDLVGLDVIYHGSQSIAQAYDHISVSDKSACYSLYKKQDLGRKAHRGFYSYDPSSGKKVGRFFTPGEIRENQHAVIVDRLIAPMLNEGYNAP
jgi:3-hydroxyacyl-CoA dehydrogenase/enoyl-CoA hydratase/3-hydroxybutyryl-CoA epimerase/enoyl-CoA isomerase